MKKLLLIIGIIILSLNCFSQNVEADDLTIRDSVQFYRNSTFSTIIVEDPDSLNQYRLKNIADPSSDLDGSNKRYVDSVMFTEPRDSILFNSSLPEKPSHLEGLLFYDPDKKTHSGYTESPEVTVNYGREGLKRAFNNTDQIIPNSTPVYLHENTFEIASDLTFEESRLVGVTTEEIGIGEWGEATVWGEQSGDFTALGVGANVYLGDGVLTNIPPSGGEFIVFIGEVQNDTILFISPSIAQYTAEMLKPTGWPDSDGNSFPDNVGIELLIDRTIILTATPASTFYHYQDGIKYISEADTFQWSAVEGVHLLYYNNGSITEIINPTDAQSRTVLENNPGVSNIYWSIPQDTFIYANNEFHTFDMNGKTKAVFHDIHGATIVDPIVLVDFQIDGTGNVDADAQFGNNSGRIRNEDILTTIPATVSTFGQTAFYREGASAWRNAFNPGFGCINTGTGRIAYNENVGGVYQLTEATSNRWIPYYFLVSNTLGRKIGMVPGTDEYTSSALAVDGAIAGAGAFLTNLPIKEIAAVAIVVYQTKDSYSNSVKGRLVSLIDPVTGNTVDYIDLSAVTIGGGGSTSPGNFIDLVDVPGTYAGGGNKILQVNTGETGLIFTD